MDLIPNIAKEPLMYLTAEKILLFVSLTIFLILIYKNVKQPLVYVVLSAFTFIAFVIILLFPIKTMWWGNNGDELYIVAYLTSIMNGGWFVDFYNAWLPSFYPPLYFWITGGMASLITESGITAFKIGVVGSTALITLGTYIWMSVYKKIVESDDKIITSPFFAILSPILLLVLLDFDAFIFKPHETLSAFWSVIFVLTLAYSLKLQHWRWTHYLFFSISGVSIFLTYYFWWILILPTLLILMILNKQKLQSITRITILGFIIFFISLPYLIPFINVAIKLGIENWQNVYFSVEDIETFAPWQNITFPSFLLLFGFIGLIAMRRFLFARALLILLVISYIYQIANLIVFLFGYKPILPSKPFTYLVTAICSVGFSVIIIYALEKYNNRINEIHQKTLLAACAIIFFSISPFIKFIDNPVIEKQFSKNFWQPIDYVVAQTIKEKIPDYKQLVWLSSSTPTINAYIPLSYYIAPNMHWSNHLAHYSKRLAFIEELTKSKTAEDFYKKTQSADPPITALIFYYDAKLKKFPLNFWVDNYPNAGKEMRLFLDEKLINAKYWNKKYDEHEWRIYTKK